MLCFIGMKLVSGHLSTPKWPEKETNESLKRKIKGWEGWRGEVILNIICLVQNFWREGSKFGRREYLFKT